MIDIQSNLIKISIHVMLLVIIIIIIIIVFINISLNSQKYNSQVTELKTTSQHST